MSKKRGFLTQFFPESAVVFVCNIEKKKKYLFICIK